jgi:hypothetical protein
MKLSPTQSLAGILEPVFAIRTEDDDRSMARPIRIQYLGATYHAVARDTHGQEISQDDQDRQRVLEMLGEACKKTGSDPFLPRLYKRPSKL